MGHLSDCPGRDSGGGAGAGGIGGGCAVGWRIRTAAKWMKGRSICVMGGKIMASFEANYFANFCGGCKEMDFLAFDPAETTLWFIEVKYYRANVRLQELELADEVAQKTRDVLSMLPVARLRDNGISVIGRLQVGDFWRTAHSATELRIILHCELPNSPSNLFPGVKDAANLQTELIQKLRSIDPHSLFTNRQLGHALPWEVA